MTGESCCCIDIYDGPEFEPTITNPVARKEHRCCECGGTVHPGERYERVEGKWDGSWSTFKTCRTCAQVRRDLMTCGWHYGELWSDLAECWDWGEDWHLLDPREEVGR